MMAYKKVGNAMSLFRTILECENDGGRVVMPKTRQEFEDVLAFGGNNYAGNVTFYVRRITFEMHISQGHTYYISSQALISSQVYLVVSVIDCFIKL